MLQGYRIILPPGSTAITRYATRPRLGIASNVTYNGNPTPGFQNPVNSPQTKWQDAQTMFASGNRRQTVPLVPPDPHSFANFLNWSFWNTKTGEWDVATTNQFALDKTEQPLIALSGNITAGRVGDVLGILDPQEDPTWHDYKAVPTSGIISAHDVWVFEVIITPSVGENTWYDVPDCGKWGKWTEIYGDPDDPVFSKTFGALKFINFKNSRLKPERY